MTTVAPKEHVVYALQLINVWAQDPANAEILAQCKDYAAADPDPLKLQAKQTMIQQMVAWQLNREPGDEAIGAFRDDITPLLHGLQHHREDPDVDANYEAVKHLLS